MLYKKEKDSILKWREDIITLGVIIVCLALFSLFPATDTLQNITRSLFFLVIIPGLYIKIILQKNFSEFGLSVQEPQRGFFWGGLMLVVSLIIGILLIHFSGLKGSYSLPAYVMTNFWFFVLYELVFINIFFFIQEFFYKGFALFSFADKLGWWSIGVSFVIYFFMAMSSGSLGWQNTPFLILAATGGIVSYKTRSFIYAYLMGILFLILFDAYLIHILNK